VWVIRWVKAHSIWVEENGDVSDKSAEKTHISVDLKNHQLSSMGAD
jgi:hypothetical protein